MNVLELAAQGVRGFSSGVRVPLRIGVNAVTPPGEPGPELGQLLAALLYADGRGGDARFATPGQKSRAAVSFTGSDGVAYRLLRELGGTGGLQRVVGGKPATISQDPAEIGQFLRAQAGLPSQSAFESLCVFTASQRPSRRPKKRVAKAAPAVSSLAAANQVEAAQDVTEAKAKLAALEDELKLSRDVETIQFEQDGIASQLFELESRLEKVSLLQSAIGDTERALKMAPTAEMLKLPKDILQRIERYPQASVRREDALARLEEERLQAIEEGDVSLEPLTRNTGFWAAVVLGFGLLASAFFLEGAARYVALLDIPVFGVAAAFALRYVDNLQKAEQAGRKEDRLAARVRKIEEDYEAEVSVVKNALRELALERPEDLVELLGRRAGVEEKLTLLQEELKALEADPEYREAARQQAALKARQEQLNSDLLQMGGGYIRDPREVERELERTRESISLAIESSQAPGESAPGEESGAHEDPCPGLLAAAADVLMSTPGEIGAQLRERGVQYVAALTERRYTNLSFSASGECTVHAAGGAALPLSEVPVADADWVYLALRLTLAERVLAPAKLPFFIEGELAGYDEQRFTLLARMVKHLGTLMQVVLVTRHASLLSAADHTVAA